MSTNFKYGLRCFGAPVLPGAGGAVITGSVFFVDSGAGSDSAGYGTTSTKPYDTLDYALSQCTAANGDVIVIMPGHAETLTAAQPIDVAGVTIVGLGNGDNRPIFTVTGQVPAINITSDDVTIANIKVYSATAGTSYAQNLMRIAASNVKVTGCEFRINQVMIHTVRIVSGDDIEISDCNFFNTYAPGAGAAGIKAQNAILNIGGIKVLVKGCRFDDVAADKAHRWKACVEGGKLTASLTVSDCTFVCRGIATRTRTAATSGYMGTLFCRAVSTSSNTSSGATYTPTYQCIIESYDVNAVNKIGVKSVTTSDLRVKREVVYLKAA